MKFIITAPFSGQTTGIPRVAHEWIRRLLSDGRVSELLLFQVTPQAYHPVELIEHPRVRVIRLRLLRKPWHILKLVREVRGADVIINFNITLDYVAQWLYRLKKLGFVQTPLVQFVYDFGVYHYTEASPDDIIGYYETIRRKYLHIPARYVVISQATKRDMQEFWGVREEKISVVYPGTFVEPREPRENFGSRTIVHVGTVEPRKNIGRLLDAFAQVREKVPEARLVLAGKKGWKVDALMARIQKEERVQWRGHVPDREIVELYRTADVCVYPSLYEGFGLPPLEAMAAGCPVITSNTSSLPEVVGEAGIMVDPTDTGALAREMMRVLADDELKKEMSNKGVARAKGFSWERSGEELIKALRRTP